MMVNNRYIYKYVEINNEEKKYEMDAEVIWQSESSALRQSKGDDRSNSH